MVVVLSIQCGSWSPIKMFLWVVLTLDLSGLITSTP